MTAPAAPPVHWNDSDLHQIMGPRFQTFGNSSKTIWNLNYAPPEDLASKPTLRRRGALHPVAVGPSCKSLKIWASPCIIFYALLRCSDVAEH